MYIKFENLNDLLLQYFFEAYAMKLLKKYEATHEIKDLYYDENNKMISFKYKDGSLGGVMIKEFNQYLN